MYENIYVRQINKTINTIQNTRNQSIDIKPKFIDVFSWTLIEKDYSSMQLGELSKQYNYLRKQIYHLNDLVVKQLQRIQRRMNKKRMNTQIEPEKMNEIRQRQISNNISILDRMKKQYKRLQNKCDNMQPKQQIQSLIQQKKQEIVNLKQKVASLKLKSKNIGDSILNTDQVLIQLKQVERQYQVWLKRRYDYEVKLDKAKTDNSNFIQELNKISNTSVQADNFFKSKQQNKRTLQENKKLQEKYNQKKHSIQTLKKNSDIFLGLKQQKYHNLLKQFQSHIQKDKEIDIRTSDAQYKTFQYSEQIKTLELKLRQIKKTNERTEYYQKDLSDISMEKPANKTLQVQSGNKIRSYSKFNTFKKSRQQTNSSRIQTSNKFETNQKSKKQSSMMTQNSTQFNRTKNTDVLIDRNIKSNFANTISMIGDRKRYINKEFKSIEYPKEQNTNEQKPNLINLSKLEKVQSNKVVKRPLKNVIIEKTQNNKTVTEKYSQNSYSNNTSRKDGKLQQNLLLNQNLRQKQVTSKQNPLNKHKTEQNQTYRIKTQTSQQQIKKQQKNDEVQRFFESEQKTEQKQNNPIKQKPQFPSFPKKIKSQVKQSVSIKKQQNQQQISDLQDQELEQNFSMQKLTIDLQKIQKNIDNVAKKRLNTKNSQQKSNKKIISFDNEEFDL